jgi:hypothetical protein
VRGGEEDGGRGGAWLAGMLQHREVGGDQRMSHAAVLHGNNAPLFLQESAAAPWNAGASAPAAMPNLALNFPPASRGFGAGGGEGNVWGAAGLSGLAALMNQNSGQVRTLLLEP